MGHQANMLSEQRVRAILNDVLVAEKLEDGVLEISSGSQKGDGYMSVMSKVKITGKNKELHLVVKWAPESEDFRNFFPIAEGFDREIYFYDKIMPAFRKFQTERNVPSPFDSVAKCYKTIGEEFSETIVMEDIKQQGFVMFEKKLLMDGELISYLLNVYGKYHAISFAMQDQNMEQYAKLTECLYEIFDHKCQEFKEHLKSGFDRVINIFDKDAEKDIRNLLINYKDKIIPFFDNVDMPKKYSAILHGDCWCNNMMFKYEEGSSTPSQMRLIDFQLLRNNTPVYDLSYVIYASSDKEVYNNLDRYLEIYYDSFSKHMKALGSDAEKMYPFKELKNDWKSYCQFGFMLATVVHKAVWKDADNMVDAIEAADSGQSMDDLFSVSEEYLGLANERTRSLVLHMFENGYIH